MKQLMLFIAIIIATGTISVYANGEKVHLKLVFEAVDAQGNRDTAEFAIRDRATNGLDPELGEVNLYGVPPQGDLDIRLVQRKVEDENYYWLEGSYPFRIRGFAENMDLKRDYRDNEFLPSIETIDFVIKVHATHYPVNVFIQSISNHNSLSSLMQNGHFLRMMMTTYKEPLNSETGYEIDSDSTNYCQLSTELDVMTAEESKIIVDSDTIFSIIQSSLLLSYLDRGVTFVDSTSRNMLLGFNYFPNGYGSVKEINNSIKLYPNPSNGFVVISEGNAGDTFEVVNSAGDKISNFTVEVFPFSYDVSALPAGVYYIINTTSANGFGKFVKE